MNIIVPTCDRYLPILKGFAFLFNKYWSSEQEVIVLCDQKPDFDLPDNFMLESIKLGKIGISTWTNYLIKFFEGTALNDDDCFLLAMDDHFLIDHVDIDLMKKAELEMKQGADKVWCGWPDYFPFLWSGYNENFQRWKSTDQRRKVAKRGTKYMKKMLNVNLMKWLDPSIWRVSMFKKFLAPDMSPGAMESHILQCLESDREYKILISKDDDKAVYPHRDCMSHGYGGPSSMGKCGNMRRPKRKDMPVYKKAWDDIEKWPIYIDTLDKSGKRV